MRMYDIIHKKRDGGILTREEISFFVEGYTSGDIPDYQAAALMMAIYFRGMTSAETAVLTECMAASGDVLDLSRFKNMSVDKHSTGGVGDKTSLIVGPTVAYLGGKVTKMSGRGLGHTGGTVDKLESIPGYRTVLSPEAFLRQVEKIGIAIIGQSGNITPADKKIYALRDVTATVDSVPLIASSIMSKKIAAGSHSIVLDVKVGSGAFMKTPEEAEVLAREMVEIGKRCGRNISAILTNMDSPLGKNVGNSLEVIEAVQALKGESETDLREICTALSAEMISLIYSISHEEAREKVIFALSSGGAFEKMKEWISAQGGNIEYLENTNLFELSPCCFEVKSEIDGFIREMDSEKIGIVSVLLGAGRASKEDDIDRGAGIVIYKKTGERVKRGETLCVLYTRNREILKEASETYLNALTIGLEKPEKKPFIYKIIR